MARKRRVEILWRAKWTCDGCKTIAEMIQAMERAANDLRQMSADGVELKSEVEDDYAFLELRTADAALLKKYEQQEEAV